MQKPKKIQIRAKPVAELLEPRVLFSADSLSALGAALLPDDLSDKDSLSEIYPDIDIAEAINAVNMEEPALELVFIDSRVPEIQSIIDDITKNKDSSVKIVVLDRSASGIQVIQQTLAQFNAVDAVHIVSHSFGEGIRLGSDILNSTNVSEHETRIASWAASLTVDADLLLYGCELAGSENGLALIDALATLTGADVAASTNHTGHASSGADWVLETSTGVVETATLVSSALQTQWDNILAPWDPVSRTLTIDYFDDKLAASATRYDSLEALYNDSISGGETDISLREAVKAASAGGQPLSSIQLLAGDYNLTIGDGNGNPDEDASVTGDLDIYQLVNIIGAGKDVSFIKAHAETTTKEFRVMDIHSGEVKLDGLTISGGITQDAGAGIRVANTQLITDDVKVTGNTSAAQSGGGISIYSASLNAFETDIQNNSSGVHGGGLATNTASATLTNSTIDNNDAVNGGGLYVGSASTVTLNNSSVGYNTASDSAGGVFAQAGTFNLNDNSIIEWNTAENFGGGITVEGTTNITSSTIINNRAVNGSGGGINVNYSTVTVYDSIVENNWAENGDGGGLSGTGTIGIINSTVTLNHAINGAGLHFHDLGNASLINSTIFDNTATGDGGGVYVSAGSAYVENTTIADNHANGLYGAIGTPGAGGGATLLNTIISNNTADNDQNITSGDSQQLATGVKSDAEKGFNVITTGTDDETNFDRQHTDIIKQNLPGYTVDARLANTLTEYNESHSKHLEFIDNLSDAIDAGLKPTGAVHKDAFGIESNEFVDVGAVEYRLNEHANKLFWIDDEPDANSVYRMNENGRALQQIIAPEETDVFGNIIHHELLDIAYDPKTYQLFYIAKKATNYDITYTSADGVKDTTPGTNYLNTGGTISTGIRMPGPDHITTALTIEQTPDANSPNILYLAQHHESNNDFRIIKTPIVAGVTNDSNVTPNNVPTVWYPMRLAGAVDIVDLPGGSHEFDDVRTINVMADPNAPSTPVISLADKGSNADNPFVIIQDGDWLEKITLIDDNGDELSNEHANSIVYDPMLDRAYLLVRMEFWMLTPIKTATSMALEVSPPYAPLSSGDFELDSNGNRIWYVTGSGLAAYKQDNQLDANLGVVDTTPTPVSLAIAKLSAVNTPPRSATSPTPTFGMSVVENELTVFSVAIDNTKLAFVDDGVNGATPASEIYFKITNNPQYGELRLDGELMPVAGSLLPAGYHFTQDDIDNNRLTYTQDGTDVPQDTFEFEVSDNQSSTRDVPGTFTITINNTNDAPTISLDTNGYDGLSINENAMPGSHVIGKIEISDVDTTTGHTYILQDSSGNPSTDFSTNLIGEIIVSAAFDYEALLPQNGEIDFNIVVDDNQGGTDTLTQTLIVNNVNEEPALSGTNSAHIDENTSGPLLETAGSSIMTGITIVDPELDAGLTTSPMEFDVLENGVLSNRFWLGNDGLIRLRLGDEIDFETAPDNPIVLELVARDEIQSSKPYTFTVTINNVNETPVITGDTSFQIEENLNGNTQGVLRTLDTGQPMTGLSINIYDDEHHTDPLANPLSIALKENNAISSRFEIDQNGVINVIQGVVLDFESEVTNPILLTVEVDDGHNPVVTRDIQVSLINVNEAPTIGGISAVEIDENLQGSTNGILKDSSIPGTPAMSGLSIYDEEHNADATANPLTLTVLENNTASNRFDIDANGVISVRQNAIIDFEAESVNPIPIVIEVSDAQGLTDTHSMNVTVKPVNEQPTLSGTSSAEIDENTTGVLNAVGSTNDMSAVTISDPELDAGLQTTGYLYQVFENGAVSTRFQMDENGLISLLPNHDIDFETASSNPIQLQLGVFDGQLMSAMHDFTVNIKDVNDAPTITGVSAVQIDENLGGNATGVLKDAANNQINMTALTISDDENTADANANPLYVNVRENGQISNRFEIDENGVLNVIPAAGLDYETDGSTFQLVIEARDSQNSIDTHNLTVTLNDVNESPTINGPTLFTINENLDGTPQGILNNSSTDQPMTGLTIYDEEHNVDPVANPLSVTVTENGQPSTRFEIDANGVLNVIAGTILDYETLPTQTIPLAIEVTDGTSVDVHNVLVKVNPVNEAPSISGTSAARISENTAGVLQEIGSTGNMTPITIFDPEKDAGTLTGELTYEVFENGLLSNRFWLGADGLVRLSQTHEIDFENTPANPILLQLVVTDEIQKSVSHDFSVTIDPIDETPTINGVTAVEVDENLSGPIDGVLIDTATQKAMDGLIIFDDEHNANPLANPLSIMVMENNVQSTRFTIDPNGVLSVSPGTMLDFETESVNPIPISVVVSDAQSNVAQYNMQVTINPVNEAPTIGGIGLVEIDENLGGAIHGILKDPNTGSAMPALTIFDQENDADPVNDTISLTVKENGAVSDRFEINQNGVLNVKPAEGLNYEVDGSSFQIVVEVVDSGNLVASHTMNVVLNPVDETPTVSGTKTATISENLSGTIQGVLIDPATGQAMSALNIFDEENNADPAANPLNVTVTENGALSNRFEIDQNGVINVIQGVLLDYETESINPIPITVVVSDGTNVPVSHNLLVTLQPINEAPTISGLEAVEVKENLSGFVQGVLIDPATGQAMSALNIDDQENTADPTANPLDITVTENGALSNRFEIDENGVLNVIQNAVLDFESEGSNPIQISVTVDDAQNEPVTHNMLVSLLPVNERPVISGSNAAAIEENTSGPLLQLDSTDVMTALTISDAEFDASAPSSELSYQVLENGSVSERFTLEANGVVSLAEGYTLDFETTDQPIQLELMVSDGALNSVNHPFFVTVNDVNESPIISGIPTDQLQLTIDTPIDLSSIELTDPDNDDLELTIREEGRAELPSWIQFNPTLNTLEITDLPPSEQSGINIEFLVDDGNGAASAQSIYVELPPPVQAALPAEPEPLPEPLPAPLPTPLSETITAPEPVAIPAPETVEQAQPQAAAAAPEFVTEIDRNVTNEQERIEIDLASLIKPLEKINLIDLTTTDNSIESINKKINFLETDQLELGNNILNLADEFNQPSDIEFQEMATEFDRQREVLAERVASKQTLIGSSFTLSSGLSVGYLLWLIRGGTLMGSVLSSLPAWRLVDPLPVLSSLGDDFGEDDESLETMVENGHQEDDAEPTKTNAAG